MSERDIPKLLQLYSWTEVKLVATGPEQQAGKKAFMVDDAISLEQLFQIFRERMEEGR